MKWLIQFEIIIVNCLTVSGVAMRNEANMRIFGGEFFVLTYLLMFLICFVLVLGFFFYHCLCYRLADGSGKS